jgi:hypothetical protein
MTVVTVTPDDSDEQLLLGLLNSTPLVAGVEHDELEDTLAWQEGHDDREALTEVRSALQSVVRGQKPPTALKPFLRGVRLTPAMTTSGIEWTLEGPTRALVPARAVQAAYVPARTTSATCSSSTGARPTPPAGARCRPAATA